MNGFDFISVYLLITFLAFWIDGLSHELPPEKCRLFFLNATAKYHEENKPPTMEDLKKIIPILIVPYDLSTPKFRCNETTVTLQNVTFTSSRALNETRLDLVFKIEPKKNLTKHWAYLCAENMLDQGSDKFREVERFLRLRNDDMSAPFYVVDQKACCEDQHLYYEPCCRKEYTLRNLTCVKDLERENDSQKGDVAKMERETGRDNCEPSGPLSVGIIIIIICASLILFVTIILVGLRVWKHKHRPNRSGYDDVPDVITTEGQSEERRDTGESTSGQNVAVPVKEETIDGYMRMQNLSQTNLIERNTRPTSITTTTTNNNNNNHNTRTSSNNESGQNSPLRSKSPNRPISRAEMLFNFDKHIPIEAIDFTNKMLGRGQFGQVELAYATISGIRKKCAVKMIRGRGTVEDERELFEELQMLYQIPYHPNVVSLLGGCMDENSPLYVVVEYCANGSLLKYLQKNRDSSNAYVNVSGPKLDFRWKLQRAIEICTGMIFLGQRQIIHRDLAARNILLDENEVAKISDFGMAKDVYLRGLYVKETAGFLPVRWMAIEAIESSIYTIKSDMWSFGILLWELYMDGHNPYPGITDGSELLEKYLKKGFRMAQPENCPDSFYQLMERCWLIKPEDRPQFTQALRELEIIKEEEMRRESEASKITEVSDADDVPVFDDEPQETHVLPPQKETQTSEEDEKIPQKEDTEVRVNESETDPIEIGVVNRGRSSIDSGANVELPCTLRKNSVEQTSYC